MTPIVDFDVFAENMLPPTKRKPKWIAWMKAVMSQLKRLYNNFFGLMTYSIIDATAPPFYDSSTVYTYDELVIFNYSVYQNMISPNQNNAPDLNSDPTDENRKWDLVQNVFIGLNERSKYTFQRIVIEWALNHYFKKELNDNSFVGFVQPDNPITPTRSSIYIDSLPPVYNSFLSYTGDTPTSLSFNGMSSAFVFTTEIYSTASSFQCQINIPSTVYTSINVDATIAEKIVRNFVDRYCISGIQYQIATY
jgi:hypothetical protein